MIRRFVVATCLGIALAGCQGGGGTSLPRPVPSTAPAGPQSITVSIKIPGNASTAASTRRRPLYVSENTQSASIQVNGQSPVIVNLSAASANCTPSSGSGRTCTFTISAPVGTDTFTEMLYANTSATGTPLSQSVTTATIVAGVANVVSITLDGVVASIVLALASPTPPMGTLATIPLTVTFDDASGAAIIGSDPFANPITLSDSDTSGATTLSRTTLNAPADAAGITLNYTGAALASAVIGASASGVAASNVTPATLTPVPTPTPIAFNDWPGYAYDAAHTGYNPNTTAITPASIANLHLAWQTAINGSTQAQPIVVTGVPGHAALLIVDAFAVEQAYDGLTGQLVWSKSLPTQDVQDCGIAGISGTAAYDKALSAIFVSAGNGNGAPNHSLLYRLDAATGNITGSVDLTPTLLPGEANYTHGGISFANGLMYVGTGSDCEGTVAGAYTAWRGRVVAVNPSTMTLQNTLFTAYDQPGAYAPQANYGGGGVWSWGGVSSDAAGNVYISSGNAETAAAALPQTISPPFVAAPNEQAGYAEQLVKTNAGLSTVAGSNYPGFNFAIGYADLDYSGTPVVFTPPLSTGCTERVAVQGKGGTLVITDPSTMTVTQSYAFSIPSGAAYYIGNPAYSPATGYLYAAITSSGSGSSMLAPGLAALDDCGTSMLWHAQFGPDSSLYSGENPRSAPTVTAGGTVFMGTPCTPDANGGCGTPGALGGALWALDATTGTILNGGKPIVVTADNIRMAPSADGKWVYLVDDSGNLYGFTVDSSVKAVAAKRARRLTSSLRINAR